MEYNVREIMESLESMLEEQLLSDFGNIIAEVDMGFTNEEQQLSGYFREDKHELKAILEEFDFLDMTCYRIMNEELEHFEHFFFDKDEAMKTLKTLEHSLLPSIESQIEEFKNDLCEYDISVDVNAPSSVSGLRYDFTVYKDKSVVLEGVTDLSSEQARSAIRDFKSLQNSIRGEYGISLLSVHKEHGQYLFNFELDGTELGYPIEIFSLTNALPSTEQEFNNSVLLLEAIFNELISYWEDEHQRPYGTLEPEVFQPKVGDIVYFKNREEMIADGYEENGDGDFVLPTVYYSDYEEDSGKPFVVGAVDNDNTFTLEVREGYWYPFEAIKKISQPNKEAQVLIEELRNQAPCPPLQGIEKLKENLLSANPCVRLSDYYEEYGDTVYAELKEFCIYHFLLTEDEAFKFYYQHEFADIRNALNYLKPYESNLVIEFGQYCEDPISIETLLGQDTIDERTQTIILACLQRTICAPEIGIEY